MFSPNLRLRIRDRELKATDLCIYSMQGINLDLPGLGRGGVVGSCKSRRAVI